jgi:RNA polymerase sigma-70 factor (ECF subfamily)
MLRTEPTGPELRVPLGTEAVWRDFHSRVRAYVGRRVRRQEEAEDVVQRIFLEVHRGLPRLRQRDRLLPWLFRVANNAVIDHYRSPAKRRELAAGGWADLEEIQGEVRTSETAADPDRVDAAHCLRPVVASLRSRDREAIEAIDLRRTTLKEAAAAIGLSLPAMKARVQRARRRLKAALLECCEFVLDGRGGVIDCTSRDDVCGGSSSEKECHDA